MAKAQPLKDLANFVESFVREVPGKLTGVTQHLKKRDEQAEEARKISWQEYDPKDIAAFAKTRNQMTDMSESELGAAKPVMETRNTRFRDPLSTSRRRSFELEYAGMAASERGRIQGLYNKSMGRLGEVRRARQRPGARKQSLITRKY